MASTDKDPAQGRSARDTPSPPPFDDPLDDSPPAYDALPPYTATAADSPAASAALAAASTTEKKKAPAENITEAFSSLHLTDEALDLPNAETCLAHLKLLYAFRVLREDVGYTDGLWGVADPEEDPKAPEVPPAVLSRLREKRWAVYLARAVDRYEAWWASLGGRELTIGDMEVEGSAAYGKFPFGGDGDGMVWDDNMLMPLDVLMVWHTHLLNPRAYLEDCIRSGRRALWLSGFPWRTVNSAIDTSFAYDAPEAARRRWELATGLPWDNVACPMTKRVVCPACSRGFEVPWTTWSPGVSRPSDNDFVGHGYGDGDFSAVCPTEDCSYSVTKETLYVAKFVNDVKKLLKEDVPMPGTLLHLPTGLPAVGGDTKYGHHSFPNHLLRGPMREKFVDLFEDRAPVTMETVKEAVSEITGDLAQLGDGSDDVGVGRGGRLYLKRYSKMAFRKLMSRYSGNRSALALDLVAAVLRQSEFIDKMFRLDWLHSPAATYTMTRLITKYTRFIDIMARHPTEMAVPTLDVDLAWHTAQLTPRTYLAYTSERCGKFINHDDKIADVALRDAFEKTSKKYQKLYAEVYSECSCWYCETTRAAHASSFGGSIGFSSQDKITDAFHSSGAAKNCPPDNSPHLSAHSSVAVAVTAHARARLMVRLEFDFGRAQKRAEKKGRKVEMTKQYFDHWGNTYTAYGPWAPPQHFHPQLYDDGCPGDVERAGCAEKTCAGGLGNGVCGGPGGCGDCGTDGKPLRKGGNGSAGCGALGGCAGGGGCGGG